MVQSFRFLCPKKLSAVQSAEANTAAILKISVSGECLNPDWFNQAD